ncbi:MAG: hypothetical protein BJ554DRAFT_6739 [Olpidium bornovanus]|uniref:CCHC-type domain-containing protein n=1 Tax=Olpidium bornovanus TaxID=278681 RepID=A0A8H8A226_9FUNG|nr:MAG: hypothetical protein BJ554DRAFT_6739 [Olpidium bornovanus]
MQTYRGELNADLCRDLTIMKVKTFDEAVKEAEELDDIAFQERQRTQQEKPERRPGREKANRVTEKLRDRKPTTTAISPKAKKNAEREEHRKKGACFYCKQLGHIALACSNKGTKN